MYSRIATLLLAILTIGFFVFHHVQKKDRPIEFTDTIAPEISTYTTIAKDEFLLLMDEGEENYLAAVLDEFDLRVIAPLGEWVHVARASSSSKQRVIPFIGASRDEHLQFRARLEAHEAIHSAQINFVEINDAAISCVYSAQSHDDSTITPEDPLYPHQWHLSEKYGIDAPGAWKITTGSADTVIAVVDRHFDLSEQDLIPDQCPTRQYYYENVLDYFPQKIATMAGDSTTHGTQVLSVLAPCTGNALGLAGVDWHAQVFAVDTKSDASFAARMFAVLWAAGIDVCTASITGCPVGSNFQKNMHAGTIINTSFGFAGGFLKDPPYGPVLDVIGRINRQGRTIVASAGNEGIMADRRLPGAAGGVISLGSSTIEKESAWFSNYGRTVDVLAPGTNIVGLNHGKPISLNGTSFSTPIASGVVSLLLAVNPLFSWKIVEYILKTTARPLTCDQYCPSSMGNRQNACRDYCCVDDKSVCAAGIIDAAAAVKMAELGVPNTALIDVDDYYVPLSFDRNLSSRVVIKNWGGKDGIVRLRRGDRHIKSDKNVVTVPAMTSDGIPGHATMTIFYDDTPTKPVVASLIFEGADVDDPTVFHDRIEAIAEIIPDPRTTPSRRKYKELLPKPAVEARVDQPLGKTPKK